LPRRARRKAKVKVVYTGPIPAPIAKGAVIATLTITAPDLPPVHIPLRAGKGVERLGLMGRLSTSLRYLLWGTLK
jgi:D-alanyl-D-alanine carboxypeptidase (penicillin-binding protein 5/6)